jgi:pimeloyl-ACP methyl ester carboxylesterase
MRHLLLPILLSSLAIAQPEIPNPLKKADGTLISTKAEWENSLRAETLQLFRENVYGVSPAGKPADFKITVVKETPDALDGKATVKELEITFSAPFGAGKIRPIVVLPNDSKKPVGAFLLINNRSPKLLDPNHPNAFFPVREIIARGYAAVGFKNADVDPDRADGYKDGIRSAFTDQPPAPNAWGSIAAWAYAASRVMDYIETEPRIDNKKVAVIGHSRGGKTALWAGAEDQRFALAISNDSGSTGAALARTKNGEKIRDINRVFPHWFCENYKKYNSKEAELPVDQHQLIALIAPRLAYVASAIEDKWADPEAEFLSCVKAAPVYALYGQQTVKADKFPEIGKTLHEGSVGYHVRPGAHDLTLTDWSNFMDFADRHWRQN